MTNNMNARLGAVSNKKKNVHVYGPLYIYIYRERERERELTNLVWIRLMSQSVMSHLL